MSENQLLLVTVPRIEGPAGPSTSEPEQHARRVDTEGAPTPLERLPPASASSNETEDEPPMALRRPSIWQLPFCAADTSWLRVTNTIVYFIAVCINVLVNSGAVWQSVRAVDKKYGPVMTPARWFYYIRDLNLFLWGLGVVCQSLAEHKGWKDGLLACIGHSWQVLWYCDSVSLLLHVMDSPAGLSLAPLFSAAALLSSLATMARLVEGLPALHEEMMELGYEGVPPLGYLVLVFPSSLSSGWLLVHHCHTTTLATKIITESDQAAMTMGCVLLVLSTGLALVLLVRLRDLVFGLAFTWSCMAVWIAGFTTQEDYRPDQLVAFFCALVLGLLTYCVAAGPQLALVGAISTSEPQQQQAAAPPAAAATSSGTGGAGVGVGVQS